MTTFGGGVLKIQCGVVEAYRLDRYDNLLATAALNAIASCRSLSFG